MLMISKEFKFLVEIDNCSELYRYGNETFRSSWQVDKSSDNLNPKIIHDFHEINQIS